MEIAGFKRVAVALAIVAAAVGNGSWAAITPEKIRSLIEDAKLLQPEYKISAAVNGEEALISTYSSTRSRRVDDDCKIDAILMAKTLMEADPEDVKRVRVRFYDPLDTKKYRQVMIREGDIKAFGSRQMDRKDLLASIDMSAGSDETPQRPSEKGIEPGILEEARKTIKRRIVKLEGCRVGVGPFWMELARIEDEVRNLNGIDDTKESAKKKELATRVDQDVERLLKSLDRQEEAVNAAQEREKAIKAAQEKSARERAAAKVTQGASTANSSITGVDEDLLNSSSGSVSLGAFTPREGPLMLDRFKIAKHLVNLSNKGIDVRQYVPMFKEMEGYARKGEEGALQYEINQMNSYLNIKPVTDEERKRVTFFKMR